MRIALDNSYLIESGEQDTFVDYDDAGRLKISWDISRRLSLIVSTVLWGMKNWMQLLISLSLH